jgi:hypothetical protein
MPHGNDERVAGYGVIGLPFASGHYLALRRFPAVSFGTPYGAVWWRDPSDRWTLFTDVPPMQSCARYIGSMLEHSETCPIDMTWTGPRTLAVRIADRLSWEIELGSTLSTRLMSAMGAVTPRWMWHSRAALGGMARMAGPMLGAGKMRLQGSVPNRQHFQANPHTLWTVTASRATIDGEDLGPIGPLQRQTRVADFWLPQRGLFFVGEIFFDPFDAARHWSP